MTKSTLDLDDLLAGHGIEADLKHYGVKGMHWGVRRPGGPNGRVKREPSADFKEARDLAKKRPSQLSNAELKKLNERLQLEQTYSSLTTKKNQQTIKEGREYVKTTLDLIRTGQTLYTLAKPGVQAAREVLNSR